MADDIDRLSEGGVAAGNDLVFVLRRDLNDKVKQLYVKASGFAGLSTTGASGSFTSDDGKTITVVNGIITAITP